MMSSINRLEKAQELIDIVIQDHKENPDHDILIQMLDALEVIEDHYREFCEGCDKDFNFPDGDTHEKGINLEYYIEASWWHDVSKQLRLLRPWEKEDV